MNGKAKKKFAALRERYYLSEGGFANLKAKLQDLYKKRAEHVGRMRALKEQQSDNLSIEDSSYIQALSSIQFLEAESQKLETVLANAEVVKPAPQTRRRVGLGSRVRLEGAGKRVEYVIVDSIEADPFSGKISDASPLGRQLLGKRLQDMVVIKNSSKQQHTLRLVSIS